MDNLIIIGAGGMGRTICSNAFNCVGYGKEFIVKGFLSDLPSLDDYHGYPSIIGTIDSYQPQANDVFICSIGDKLRKNCVDKIVSRGGRFINLIHNTAIIHSNANIGSGNFIGAYTIIGNDVTIGDYNMIQSHTVIGHDAVVGNYNRIDTHVTCVGGVIVENCTNIHTSAVINHRVIVEDNANIGALSFVIRRVRSGTTVMGNPAKKLM